MKIEVDHRVFYPEGYSVNETAVYSEYEKVPDPNWTFTDGHGHRHFWERDELPTLENGMCKLCGEPVYPKFSERSAPMATVQYYRYDIILAFNGWHGLSTMFDSEDKTVLIDDLYIGRIRCVDYDSQIIRVYITIISVGRLNEW